MIHLGKVKPGSTVEFAFGSFAGSTGAPSAVTGNATSDIQIYKDGGTTQRASASGVTFTVDFDTLTGVNYISIDLSDNTTADFYAAGSRYTVVVSDVTIDGQTMRFPVGSFVIGLPEAILDTTIATLASQTSFTLTSGSADNNAYVGCTAYIHDAASGVQCAMGVISAYTGSTKTVTLAADPAIFTMAAKDNISILPRTNVYAWNGLTTVALPLAPTVAGRTLDVSAGGEAGVDWANVGSPTTSVNLSGTTIATTQQVDVNTIKTQTVTCAAGVTVLASVGTAATSTAQTGDAFARLGAPAGASVSADIAAIQAKTTNLPASPAASSDIPSAATVASAVLTTAMTESYAADGATRTLAQASYEVLAHLGESSIAGTTKTLKKVDGTTTAATFTLNDASTPTSITRAT